MGGSAIELYFVKMECADGVQMTIDKKPLIPSLVHFHINQISVKSIISRNLIW